MRIALLIVAIASVLLLASPYYYLAPLPAVGLIAIFALLRNPAIGFYVIVLLIPFGSYRKIGPVNVPWIMALMVFLVLALQFVREKRLPPVSRSNLWPFIGLFLMVSVLSTLFAEYPTTARSHLMLLVAGYGFVFMGMVFLSPTAFRVHIPNAVIWSVGISAAMALLGHYVGLSAFSEAHLSGDLIRTIGGASDPNNLSLMILFALPIVVHRVFYPQYPGERAIMCFVAPMLILTITTTFSRSGFLMTLLTLTLLLVHYRRRIRPKALGFLVLIALLGSGLALTMVPNAFWERQLSLVSWKDDSLGRRTSYIAVGVEAFTRRPLLGAGPGSFSMIYGQSEVSRKYAYKQSDRYRRAHNTYLDILVGTGLLGMALFLAINYRALRNFRAAEQAFLAKRDEELANLAASQRIGFFTLLAFLLTFSELYHKHMLLSLVLSQGALYIARHRSADKKPARVGYSGMRSANILSSDTDREKLRV